MTDPKHATPSRSPATERNGIDLTTADAFDVPPEADPHRCSRCGRPLPTADLHALHLGIDHWADLTDAERRAYVDAAEREQSALHRFRIVSLGTLVALYFGFLFAYAVFA